MKHARAPIAAFVTVGAVAVAMLAAGCTPPLGRQPFPGTSGTAPSASDAAGQSDSPPARAGHALSVVSLAPGIAWAGLNYQATLVVTSDQPVTVENISVGVRSDTGERDDFPGMHAATVDGPYVFTSLSRQFSPGVYSEFGTYEIDHVWYNLPTQTLRVLAGPSLRIPDPAPAGIPGRWTSTLNAGPTYQGGEVRDTVSDLMTWNGATGRTAVPNNTYEDACYSPTNVALQGSVIALSLTQPSTSQCSVPAGYAPEPYYGAQISTRAAEAIAPGAAVEAEIYIPPASDGTIADWPAFWLNGPNWPTAGEIDVFEGLGGQGCYHFHWGTLDNVGTLGQCTSIGPGWHVFGLDWQPANASAAAAKPGAVVSYRTTYYYDGKDVGSIVQSGVDKEPMVVLLDITDKVPVPDLLPATMLVAYVRAWSGG